ncbi:MAG: hypothetical protein F4213_22145 [Boseongicola sp. SB0677_bin_26]|nr:hypothetical protein [Boseongicola sp. SB0665_bin_10]MYG28682.1 hypothetical protein [Boseongicola sp. SB0677_bin_26]
MRKRGKDMEKLATAVTMLACQDTLPTEYRDRPLSVPALHGRPSGRGRAWTHITVQAAQLPGAHQGVST